LPTQSKFFWSQKYVQSVPGLGNATLYNGVSGPGATPIAIPPDSLLEVLHASAWFIAASGGDISVFGGLIGIRLLDIDSNFLAEPILAASNYAGLTLPIGGGSTGVALRADTPGRPIFSFRPREWAIWGNGSATYKQAAFFLPIFNLDVTNGFGTPVDMTTFFFVQYTLSSKPLEGGRGAKA
jgi:hypothetical protein